MEQRAWDADPMPEETEQDVRLCPCTHKGVRCVLPENHGGTEHESAMNVRWPMHLPYVQVAHCGTCTCGAQ